MSFFGLVWVTSWVSCLLASSQDLLKVPNYLASAFPAGVFSVVSNPVEIPTTEVFSTQFSSEVQSSNFSVAAVPNLAFQRGTGTFGFRSQPAQAALGLPLGIRVENTFCRPHSEQQEHFLTTAAISQSSSAVVEATSSPDASKTLPQQILQVVQNLFHWGQRVEPVKTLASSVEVVSTRSWDRVGDKQNRQEKRVKLGLWRYAQLIANRAVAASSPRESERFQVWLKGRLIAQLPNQEQADLMGQRLKEFLSNPSDPYLNTSPVEPALVDGIPGVKVGHRVLIKIDDALAQHLASNRDLLAIEWANNLRRALGKTPFNLAESQKRMYDLVETPRIFEGKASWYGHQFHGRLTATGETYNQHELTAAHPSLPFNTYLKVRNLKNGDSVIVRINDRGPFIPGRNLDLSREAARCIKSEKVGVVPFEAVIMESPPRFQQYLVRNES